MRLREITETKQINELFPIIGVIGATVIPGLGGMTIVAFLTAVLAVWSILDIYDYAVKLYKDPTSMDTMDWAILIFELAFIKGPLKTLSREAKDKIISMIPQSVKESMGKAVKEKVMKEVGKDAPGTANDIYKPQPRRNRVDNMPGTKPEAPAATATPPSAPKTAPKNPNLIDRPFKKEELLRLAGLAK